MKIEAPGSTAIPETTDEAPPPAPELPALAPPPPPTTKESSEVTALGTVQAHVPTLLKVITTLSPLVVLVGTQANGFVRIVSDVAGVPRPAALFAATRKR